MKDWSFTAKGLRDTVKDAVSKSDLAPEAKAFLLFLIASLPADKTACCLDAHSHGGVGHWHIEAIF